MRPWFEEMENRKKGGQFTDRDDDLDNNHSEMDIVKI